MKQNIVIFSKKKKKEKFLFLELENSRNRQLSVLPRLLEVC